MAVGSLSMAIAPLVLYHRTGDPVQFWFSFILLGLGVLRLLDGHQFWQAVSTRAHLNKLHYWELRYAILGAIYSHVQKPEFQARIRWAPGDVTMWDNRATWHKAINDYHGFRRYMHRVTVEGCPLTTA